MALPAAEEGKLLSEALNTVKIQVQQMKRHLVCRFLHIVMVFEAHARKGARPAHGRFKECKLDACRIANLVTFTQTIL